MTQSHSFNHNNDGSNAHIHVAHHLSREQSPQQQQEDSVVARSNHQETQAAIGSLDACEQETVQPLTGIERHHNTNDNGQHPTIDLKDIPLPQRPDLRRGRLLSIGSNMTDDPKRGPTSVCTDDEESSPEHEPAEYAADETRWLNCSKLLFFLVLAVAAASSSIAVFLISSRDENRAYETRFRDFANEIIAVSNLNARFVVRTYETVSLQMTASIHRDKRDQWPMVYIEGFEGRGQQLINTTETTYTAITPIVPVDQRSQYERYVRDNSSEWIQESLDFVQRTDLQVQPHPHIFAFNDNNEKVEPSPTTSGVFLPIAQIAPIVPLAQFLNLNGINDALSRPILKRVLETKATVLSTIATNSGSLLPNASPSSLVVTPIWRTINGRRDVVATIVGNILWTGYFRNLVPDNIDPIYLVVRSACKQEFTYLVEGPNVSYVGEGDLYPSIRIGRRKVKDLEVDGAFEAFETLDGCEYTLHVFPSKAFYETYNTSEPVTNAITVAVTFLVTAAVFVLYDYFVERRQTAVVKTAKKSDAIVSSLFPANVRDRLMNDERSRRVVPQQQPTAPQVAKSKPIADLFPRATVLFADISGFTAWSSMREPEQVFELLESLYNSFDKIARRLDVFKVETIGDCYVAVAGLPEPNPHHALIMTRFAKYCMIKMREVVHRLAVQLGPDTKDLSLRSGLHSGPVTAGVLRGDKSRFQLFGDTVNTAARMEQTGVRGRIHISQETANDLIHDGKHNWIVERADKVMAKGKGELQTYWVIMGNEPLESKSDSSTTRDSEESHPIAAASTRSAIDRRPPTIELRVEQNIMLRGDGSGPATMQSAANSLEVQWNVDVLKHMLQRVVAGRDPNRRIDVDQINELRIDRDVDATVLDEMTEVIHLPGQCAQHNIDPNAVALGPAVVEQTEDFVETVASMYRRNPFHNFSHASHVVQSTVKLLSRIVRTDTIDYEHMMFKEKQNTTMHNFSFGITSDPLIQLACVIAALIHDLDHPGVPNAQLIKEQKRLAQAYRNQSIAEQNSLDLAWDLLMEDRYKDLRACIYTTQDEMERFRQLLVNAVIATDVMDKELNSLRKARWHKAFMSSSPADLQQVAPCGCNGTQSNEDMNRMATIVIEHLIQASDVCHTMQHWHIYTKWNEKLFDEMYQAYLSGRASEDPSKTWYQGEIGFFDFYIIPLANKLRECGVFGVSSDEYLNYAQANRKEWEMQGPAVVEGYLRKYQSTAATNSDDDDTDDTETRPTSDDSEDDMGDMV